MTRWAKPILAGLLVVLLLVLTTFAVCPALHQAFHGNAATPSSTCLVCHLARGLVHAADVTPPTTAHVPDMLPPLRPPNVAPVDCFAYRFSPGRAPPLLRFTQAA